MKYTKIFLKKKTNEQLMNIILRLQNKKPNTKFTFDKVFVVADRIQGMRRGE